MLLTFSVIICKGNIFLQLHVHYFANWHIVKIHDNEVDSKFATIAFTQAFYTQTLLQSH